MKLRPHAVQYLETFDPDTRSTWTRITHPEPDPRDPGRWCVLVVGRRTREAGVWGQRNVPSTAHNTSPKALSAYRRSLASH